MVKKYQISSIYIYPVKSLGGVAVNQVVACERGFQNDRRWMIVDENGQFISQRQYPKMALIATSIEQEKIVLQKQGSKLERAEIPLNVEYGESIKVDIWKDQVMAIWPGLPADQWISRILGQSCRFVYLPENGSRLADGRYSTFDVNVSFADTFPYLLIGQSSLDDLNNRLNTNLKMSRFRPNIVVTGAGAFEEDRWKKIRIGSLIFHLVKPCARCVVPTIDPETGLKGKEPLKTLAKYRKLDDKIYFGQNMILEGSGGVLIDQEVEILESR